MFLSEWREFPSRLAFQEKKTWQLASRCCWNRARPWYASDLVTFVVGLRTYQHPVQIRLPYILSLAPNLRLIFIGEGSTDILTSRRADKEVLNFKPTQNLTFPHCLPTKSNLNNTKFGVEFLHSINQKSVTHSLIFKPLFHSLRHNKKRNNPLLTYLFSYLLTYLFT